MITDSQGRRLWIADELGDHAPVKSHADIQSRTRGPGEPDWWVVAKDPDWTPSEPRSLLSLGAAGESFGNDSGGGTKIGAGGKPQPYGWHGYYGETGGGSSNGPVYRGKVKHLPLPTQLRQETSTSANPAGGYDPQGNPVYTYMQCSGNVYDPEGGLMGEGYSGAGPGFNNPKMEHVPFVGPIPAGFYRVGAVIPDGPGRTGKNVLPLTPVGLTVNKLSALVRGGFYWHGGRMTPPFDSSEGCIVSSPSLRSQVQKGSLVRVLPCEKE